MLSICYQDFKKCKKYFDNLLCAKNFRKYIYVLKKKIIIKYTNLLKTKTLKQNDFLIVLKAIEILTHILIYTKKQ